MNGNIGIHSLSIIHGCFILSSACLPHPLIGVFGLKWALALDQVPYLLYLSANYYPKPYLIYQAAALVGMASAPLWTSGLSYVIDSASIYAKTIGVGKDVILNRSIGIFYMFYQSGQVWGNLISYLVLSPSEQINVNSRIFNNSWTYEECGADFNEQEYQSSTTGHMINTTDLCHSANSHFCQLR
ncbi:unnamed protein product [Rotaria socialis]|uniref:Uncharacterized protein n=2 Tax=Rotaria socialis TaxID=392032 RepID=A0A821I460_9BILA|nr:unnamed protein product [Rotaria socialis]CAF3382702.1 unnamed protein product [Rotaria socialis]CAF3680808.1 unnamed protein product [Rotaria socialis]CAF4356640.1 unnamed protein product [Rotaria socialis]CAF4652695.1 unnamed protein product [Rotaria socialis]